MFEKEEIIKLKQRLLELTKLRKTRPLTKAEYNESMEITKKILLRKPPGV